MTFKLNVSRTVSDTDLVVQDNKTVCSLCTLFVDQPRYLKLLVKRKIVRVAREIYCNCSK